MDIDISKEGYLNLIKEVYKRKIEERQYALDRYRKADEMMESAEQFVLMGKNAVSFLTLASNSTSDIANLAKEIKSIVYKDNTDSSNGSGSELDDDFKMAISTQIEELEQAKHKDKDDKKENN